MGPPCALCCHLNHYFPVSSSWFCLRHSRNDFDDDEQYRENPSSSSLSRQASLVERKSLIPAVAASTRMSSALIRRLGIGRSRLRSRDFKNMSIFATIDKELRAYQADIATVLRNGCFSILPATDLVPGDIVEVSVGCKIPADMRMIETLSYQLRVDQAILTGESCSVGKELGSTLTMNAVYQDKTNILFS